MNLSTIATMLTETPEIMDDVPSFVKRMNEQDIRQVIRSHQVVIDEEILTSIAEMNGGICTERDVKEAYLLLARQPILDAVDEKAEQVKQVIAASDVTDQATVDRLKIDVATIQSVEIPIVKK